MVVNASLCLILASLVQVIPHNFGRQRPPIIASQSMVEIKIRMCDVLSDIEVAQDLLEPKEKEEERIELQANPADEKYATLMADLNVIPTQNEEYKIVEKYCQVRQNMYVAVILSHTLGCLSRTKVVWFEACGLCMHMLVLCSTCKHLCNCCTSKQCCVGRSGNQGKVLSPLPCHWCIVQTRLDSVKPTCSS